MDTSPGFKAGIMSGDRIVRIDGKSTEKMTSADAVKVLRGDPGTEVKLPSSALLQIRPKNSSWPVKSSTSIW
jgi:C-terminal processing protease CtpA/Prc